MQLVSVSEERCTLAIHKCKYSNRQSREIEHHICNLDTSAVAFAKWGQRLPISSIFLFFTTKYHYLLHEVEITWILAISTLFQFPTKADTTFTVTTEITQGSIVSGTRRSQNSPTKQIQHWYELRLMMLLLLPEEYIS